MIIPRKKILLLLVYSISLTARLAAETRSLNEALQQDLQDGKISRAQSLGYQLLAAEHPDRLPLPYKELEPQLSQSLTVLAAEARALMMELSGSDRQLLQAVLQRPSPDRLPLIIISPSGRFKIHYTTTGFDSCSHQYAQEVAETYDYVYQFEVEKLGFDPPPPDQGIDGPEYDIYIVAFSPYYGETVYENEVPGSEGKAYTSFSKIDRNFDDPRYFTKGIDAMHVTAAHEFFHMIHGGYRFFPTTQINSVFLFEASSVWMEEMAYPNVNDYLQYVKTFMQYPNRAFHLENNSYALCLYFHMLTKQYGSQIVNRIWEAFRNKEPFEAIDAGLKKYHDSFERSLALFTSWNCFTDAWADTIKFYHEGHLYPRLTPWSSQQLDSELTISGSCSELVSHYYQITVYSGGKFSVRPQLQNPADWFYSVVVQQPNAKADAYIIAGDEPLSYLSVAAGGVIWINPTNINRPQHAYSNHPLNYAFTIERSGVVSNAEEGIVAINPTPFKPHDHNFLEIQYRFVSEQSSADLYIFNENGQTIHHAVLGRVSKGLNRYFWYGKNDQGQPVATGVYLCFIKGEKEPLQAKKLVILR